MNKISALVSFLAVSVALVAEPVINAHPLAPRAVSTVAKHDTDDPAIWIHPTDPAQSLILGTDKDVDGALRVYGLDGVEKVELSVRGILRPNNVDIAYGLMVGGKPVDVAVVTERFAHRLRVYRLPDMAPLDGGGIPVFEGEAARDPMGIALYTRPTDDALFAIVSRSDAGAPTEGYLHQYRLIDDGAGTVRGVFTRAFGTWSGRKEVEAIAVDHEQGHVYYSDETYGIRQYEADPLVEDADDQLAEFGLTGFARDHEGISIYPTGPGTGYILVSDQQANTFRIFAREGTATDPYDHRLLGAVRLSTDESDGSDVTAAALPGYPGGLFVAMSTDRTFQFYAWDDLLKAAGL
ncbi:phytase [Synoicihabitans lomoniglobus]|uniref:Phytase n=1 Tax=Synoicihabitans lomoniglobus TaxID=2909285 RepID=A0AAF0CPG6_9BACT|nr:phytase [Opitutaceae bacterium LMO-M01]WED64639.1 phytase [Opitutaceae bacterium LMO-M01]